MWQMFDSEQAIIGTLLLEPRSLAQIREQVETSDFQSELGRAVFSAACSLADAGLPVDPVTIKSKAAERGAILTEEELYSAMQLGSTVWSLPTHIQGMRDDLLRADLLDSMGQSQLRLMQGEPPQIVCGDLMAELEKAVQKENSKGIVSGQDAILDFMDYREEVESGKKLAFLSTGFTALDNALGGGFVPQSLNILAARPGCGKTTFALQIAEKVASRGIPVLFVSLEMPNNQLTARRLAVDSGMSSGRLLVARLMDDEYEKLSKSVDKLAPAPIYFSKENRASVGSIGVMARRVKNCGLVVVDYLGLLQYEPGKSLYEQVTKTSNAMKRLALSLGFPILCLCQLNREVEARKGDPPRLSDLRDSGAIEQDADSVLLLHKPQEADEEGKAVLTCRVGKNRHGPAGGEPEFNWYMKSGKIISSVYARPKETL